MEVKEISKDEFTRFLDGTFHTPMQSAGMYERLALAGRNPKIYGGFENGELVIAGTGGFNSVKKVAKYLYMPYGPVSKYPRDTRLVKEFFEGIKGLLKHSNVLAIRFDPAIERMPFDKGGEPHPELYDNNAYRTELESAGFIALPLSDKNLTVGQPRQVSIIDLAEEGNPKGYGTKETEIKTRYTMADLLKKMDGKTRNSVKQSVRPYIKTRDTDAQMLEKMGQLSGEEKGFAFAGTDAINQLKQGFGEECELKLAYLDVPAYKEEAEKGIKEQQAILDQWEGKTSRKAAGKIREAQDALAYHEKQKQEAETYLSEGKTEIPLAASMFLYSPDTTFYMFSGMDRQYAHLRGQNRLLYDTMEKSIERGARQFNLMGIAGNYKPGDENYSLYLYKKGLGGRIGEYVGTFWYPVSKLANWLINQVPE